MNATKETSDLCELHHVKMKKTIVGTQFGFGSWGLDREFPNAKGKLGLGCVIPSWPKHRLAIIYHCSKCDSFKRSKIDK